MVGDFSTHEAGARTTQSEDRSPRRDATCPLCHTTDVSLTDAALAAGGRWRCLRCGQPWDAAGLTRVAAYSAWALEHDR